MCSLLSHSKMMHEGDSAEEGVRSTGVRVNSKRLSNKDVRATMTRFWRYIGWSEAELNREALHWHVNEMLSSPRSSPLLHVGSTVAYIQYRLGRELVDLTWAEAFEVFFDFRCRELRLARKLLHHFGGKDWRVVRAINGIKRVLRRRYKEYQAWQEEGRSGLSSDVLEAYRHKVRGYWDDEAAKRRETTKEARRQAKKLQSDLDDDPDVIKLRRKLGIPYDGFEDVDEAACWLYDRWPPDELLAPYGPEPSLHEYGRRQIYKPAVLHVSVLAEATTRLRKRHDLNPDWDLMLCFYLLRGKLDPLPRKIVRRQRPMEEVHQEIYELSEKYRPCWKAVMYFRYRLTDEDWSEIATKYPWANKTRWSWSQKRKIKQVAELIAERKGKLDPRRVYLTIDERFEQYFRTVKYRMKDEKKM